MADVTNGWALEAWAGVYHFEAIGEADAAARLEHRERVFVVETVSQPDDGEAQLNKYFVEGLPAAIGMAAKLLGDLRDSAEAISDIRPATPVEENVFLQVIDHFNQNMPPVLPDDEAARLKGAS